MPTSQSVSRAECWRHHRRLGHNTGFCVSSMNVPNSVHPRSGWLSSWHVGPHEDAGDTSGEVPVCGPFQPCLSARDYLVPPKAILLGKGTLRSH